MEIFSMKKHGIRWGFESLSICIVLWLLAGAVAASDWPCFRGPDRTGVVDGVEALENGENLDMETIWQESLGFGFTAFAVSDGKAFVMGNVDDRDILYCFDAHNGDLIWKESYSEKRWPRSYEGGPNASPVVHEGRVYTLSKTGKAFARNVDDGSVIWNLDIRDTYGIGTPKWGISGSPLIVDDLVVFNVGSNGMAFDRVSGEKKWGQETGTGAYATPVRFERGGETILAMFLRKELALLEPDTGRIITRFPWETNNDVNASDPIVFGNNIFISSGYNKGCALLEIENSGLSEIWSNRNIRTQMNGCVLFEGNLYGFDDSRELRCLDFHTGEVKWSQGGLGKGTLFIAGGHLIILSERGNLVIAEATPEGYNKLAEKQILGGRCWTMPIMAGGRIYARNAAGDAVCVEIKEAAVDAD